MKLNIICGIFALIVGTSGIVYVINYTSEYGKDVELPVVVDNDKLVFTLLDKPVEGDIV